MDKVVYPAEEFKQYVDQKGLIVLKYNLDKADPDNIATRFNIVCYPTFIYLTSDEKEIVRSVNSAPTPEAFGRKIDADLHPENSYEAHEERLKKEPSYVYEYINFIGSKCQKRDVADKKLYELLHTLPLELFFTEDWLRFYKHSSASPSAAIVRYLVANEKKATKVIGQKAYDELLREISIRMFDLKLRYSRRDIPGLPALLNEVNKHSQLQTTASRFIETNMDAIVNKDGEKLYSEGIKALKKSDTQSRNLLCFLSLFQLENEVENLKELRLNLYRTAAKYEKNPKVKAEFEKTVDNIIHPKPLPKEAIRK